MPPTRRASERRTLVRRGDPRCRGRFRQPSDDGTPTSPIDDALPWTISCVGRLTTPTSLDWTALATLATLHDDRIVAVALTDLMAHLGLRTDADVLTFADTSGRSVGIPIRDALTDDRSRLALGTVLDALEPTEEFVACLDVPGWTDTIAPLHVARIQATDFDEFMRCP